MFQIPDLKKMDSFLEKLHQILWKIFIGLLILLYAIVIGSSSLAILGLFRFWFALILSTAIFLLVILIWRKFGRISFDQAFRIRNLNQRYPDSNFNRSLLSFAGFISSAVLLTLILIPIVNWPMSAVENALNGDAALYHFPKAIEMWLTGSAWDFSISLADYPFGYESLLSFILLFTRNVSAFSIAHVLIALIAILGSWFLALRYTRLPSGVVLFGIELIIVSGLINFPNPWYFLHHLAYSVGKNDLILAAATISAMLFVPLHQGEKNITDWVGLGIASGLSISIKPNSALILAILWIYALIHRNKDNQRSAWLVGMIAASLGGGWIVRNLIGIQGLFLPHDIINQTIWSNISQPGFLQQIPNSFKFSIAILLLVGVAGFFKLSRINKWDVLLFSVTLFSFMITPASAKSTQFFGVVWRFGSIVLLLQFIYLLALLDPLSTYLFNAISRSRIVILVLSGLMFLTSCGLFGLAWDEIQLNPKNADQLTRSYVDNEALYPSVFDYIDINIHHSVVWIEGSYNYYAYDQDFTNSLSRSTDADYLVLVNKSPQDLWFDISTWDLLYEDSVGQIFSNPSSNSQY